MTKLFEDDAYLKEFKAKIIDIVKVLMCIHHILMASIQSFTSKLVFHPFCEKN